MPEHVELYRKHRPTKPTQVVGQDHLMKPLGQKVKEGKVPHTILATGPSGVGKTTVFRILRNALKCADVDYQEINASDERGIEMVRGISKVINLAPLSSPCRIWMIDECHALTGDAQNAFLKYLEDTPKHVYFFLATTDPQKLKKTIITRCEELKFKEISAKDLEKLIITVAKEEGHELDAEIVEKIAVVAQGSARKALVLLNSVIDLPPEQRLGSVEANDVQREAIEIARALMNPKTDWGKMKELLKANSDDPESLRNMVMAYARTVLLGNNNQGRAALVIDELRDAYYDGANVGKAKFALACYNVIFSGE